MTTKQTTKPVTPPCTSGAHHWMVEPFEEGNGGIVGAACKRCGVTRTFDNTVSEKHWNSKIAKVSA